MISKIPKLLMVIVFFLCFNNHSFASSPEWPECVTTGLNQGVVGVKVIDGQQYFVRRLSTIYEGAIDDYGSKAVADYFEIFCVSRNTSDRFGKIAMCLSGEECNWR